MVTASETQADGSASCLAHNRDVTQQFYIYSYYNYGVFVQPIILDRLT